MQSSLLSHVVPLVGGSGKEVVGADTLDLDLDWTDLDLYCILTSIQYTKNTVYMWFN